MFGIGTHELLIIFLLIVVIFGAKRLPEIGRGLGRAIRDFRKAASEPDEIDVTKKSGGESGSKDA
ncbi:twin-arginine translocase TatA/TatE family subunit [uncultured Mailhella sp.]|uniref:twin-arginine translocase TatA/TatE family subunit n=1 Tax=uncultured Mailhella sp. TaxID=1981031 RepID=UPI00261308D4|nr:twin-arginine translocase TatA/TatE family subunit [uncultured Mailhella sp.]